MTKAESQSTRSNLVGPDPYCKMQFAVVDFCLSLTLNLTPMRQICLPNGGAAGVNTKFDSRLNIGCRIRTCTKEGANSTFTPLEIGRTWHRTVVVSALLLPLYAL